jgi:hypothetical protein
MTHQAATPTGLRHHGLTPMVIVAYISALLGGSWG